MENTADDTECPTPYNYSCMFCSRCPTWNNIYIQSWAHLYRAENSGWEMQLFEAGHSK